MKKKKEKEEKEKVWFADNVKMPTEAGMLYTIDRKTFHLFTKNKWIEDSGASCHITKDETSLFDVTEINKSVQGSLGSIPVTKNRKLHMNIWQVDGNVFVVILS